MRNLLIIIGLIGVPLFSQGVLSQGERDSLKYVKESEELAYKLYSTLYEMWEHETFNELKKAEKSHVDTIEKLITEYNIVVDSETSPYFKRLYTDFTKKALDSFNDALYIAATVEEMAIFDYNEYLKASTDERLKNIYTALSYRSMANLRLLNKQLEELGSRYEGKYLSIEEMRRILGS